MRTGLLPNHGASPASADDSYSTTATAVQQQHPSSTTTTKSQTTTARNTPSRGRSRRRRRVAKSSSSTVSAAPSAPTNATSILWAFILAGLLGTLMNIGYVATQTALKWETETTTADFTQQQQVVVPIPNNPHLQQPQEQLQPQPPQQQISSTHVVDDPFYDKEPLLQLLKEAGMGPIDNATAASLPTWSEITRLYGNQPLYHGLDSCARFQGSGIAAHHFLATAGTFNTGTNLLSEMLIANCHMPARMAQYGPTQKGIRWQVVWGKHTPVGNETFRQTHRTYTDVPDLTADDVFAAVMIRDPYRWMQSMCRHKYGASWLHDESHCPSLVPNHADLIAKPHLATLDHIPVHVEYAKFTQKHDSLVHFWNEWYQGGSEKNKKNTAVPFK